MKPRFYDVKYTCPHCGGPGNRKIQELPAGSRLSECRFWCPICKKPVSISVRFESGRVWADKIWVPKGDK